MPDLAPSPALVYERHFVPAMFGPWAQALLSHLRPAPGQAVLDVACGTGVVARTAAAAVGPGGRVTGVDLSPPMLAVARTVAAPEPAAPIEWLQGSALQLPCDAAAFDLALCQHGFQFFPDRAKAATEMRRVLRPGGRAAALVLQGLPLHPVFEAVMASLARRLGQPLGPFAIPFSMPAASDLEQPFAAAGFASLQVAPVAIEARFAQAPRFVPLAVASSAAAVPAFADLPGGEREALLAAVQDDVAPVLARFTDGDLVHFPMLGHLLVAHG